MDRKQASLTLKVTSVSTSDVGKTIVIASVVVKV